MSSELCEQYRRTRSNSLRYCAPLNIEDYNLQADAFARPPKWHLAHTSDPAYEVLFNSYYNGIGEQFPRPRRGLLSRPGLDEVRQYREHVDRFMEQLLALEGHAQRAAILKRCTLGIAHETQHQELFFTDIKYSLAANPLYPAYADGALPSAPGDPPARQWLHFAGGLAEIGHAGERFAFDNELPRHKVWLEPFSLADRLVTNSEYQAFIDDGGYQRAELWLADGWEAVQVNGWRAPQYWREVDGAPMEFTLAGLLPRQGDRPVCHVSGYEAEAFARWAGARLPTEQEWEHAAAQCPSAIPTAEQITLHPQVADRATGPGPLQLYDNCWQWTRSAYTPYPGFAPPAGAIGEYNGKFMSNQWVLRGGSCVSEPTQLRPSYRNFFYPGDRWQFSGIRLAN